MKKYQMLATDERRTTKNSLSLHSSIALLLLIWFSACSSEPQVELPEEIAAMENVAVFPAESEPLHELTLTPVTVLGDTEEVLLSDWLTTHTDPRGRVFIGDNRETAIHLFNADGTYNRRIGGEGDGPGEYRSVGVMRSDDTFFYHYDNRNRRITRYNADTFEVDGDFTVSVPSDEDAAFPRSFRTFYLTDMENRMLAITGMGIRADRPDADQSERRTDGFLLNSETGEFTGDKIFSFQAEEALVHYGDDGSMAVMPVPYKRSPVIRYHNGEIIHGWNDHFLFRYYDLNGEYLRAVYYPYENPPLDRNEVLRMYENRTEPWRGMVRNDRMPDTWPSYTTFLPDDEGRLWVQRRTANPDATEFHVLDSSGELLAVFPWESDRRVQQIRDGNLYSLEENEDGLRELVQYRIEM